MLYDDNTEAMVFDRDEIITFGSDGLLGITKADWEMSPVYAAQLALNSNINIKIETGDEQNMPQIEQAEISKKDIPVYKFMGETAAKNGEIDAFRASRKLNAECGEALDAAILANTKRGEMAGTQYIDTKAAVQSVIAEFGVDRTAWVVASIVNYHDFDGRLSDTNKAWAKEFETPVPDYHIKTHLTVFESLTNRFREAAREKPSLLDTLDKNEQKSKQQGSKKPETAVDTKEKPKKPNREDI